MSDHLATVRQVIQLMAVKDYDAALPFFTEDCEYTNLPMGTLTGPAGVKATLEPFFAPVIENDLVILRSAVDGDTVFIERLDRHRIASGWVELPVTGVFVLREGRIAVWREYFDMATLLRQWPELAASLG
jgi:limonene-1,2-epoxide hydrolase